MELNLNGCTVPQKMEFKTSIDIMYKHIVEEVFPHPKKPFVEVALEAKLFIIELYTKILTRETTMT